MAMKASGSLWQHMFEKELVWYIYQAVPNTCLLSTFRAYGRKLTKVTVHIATDSYNCVYIYKSWYLTSTVFRFLGTQ